METIVSSPLALFITAAAAVVTLAVIRVLANTFHGSKPPIFEGIPFVGGLMKFAGVRLAAVHKGSCLFEHSRLQGKNVVVLTYHMPPAGSLEADADRL